MYLFHLFRSFLPLHNPIGFGAIDFTELAFAGCLLAVLLGRPAVLRFVSRRMSRPAFTMAVFGALPIVLRLMLLGQSPVPTANGSDDFSYLLLGDTLAHFRLANPTHPFYRFFETNFVLQQPTYSSIFPLGQGIALALGRLFFGEFWAGVVLSIAALCALSYWMLRGWTTNSWAMVGGLLAVIEFGPLCQWMNCYFGGAVSGVAGCLVFGALPRLRRSWRTRDAILLGVGVGLELLTRPFECGLLLLCVLGFFTPIVRDRACWRRFGRAGAVAIAAFVPAALLMALQNKAVTGSWTTLPYLVSRYEYGVPATFTFQTNPQPHRELTPEQEMDYKAQSAIHGDEPDTMGSYLRRLAFRLRYYRFFFLPPLYLVLPVFFFSARRRLVLYVTLAIALFAVGTNFYPYFYPHYIAALTSLFLLVGVVGLETLSKIIVFGSQTGRAASATLLVLCAGHFLFWYALHLAGSDEISDVFDYETANYINSGDPEGRIEVNSRLETVPGKQLVFVRYSPEHEFHEWIHNAASIDRSRVVWAGDRGADNENLIQYFRDRKVWLLEPDADPPRLAPYPKPSSSFEDVR